MNRDRTTGSCSLSPGTATRPSWLSCSSRSRLSRSWVCRWARGLPRARPSRSSCRWASRAWSTGSGSATRACDSLHTTSRLCRNLFA
nr:MAG TPA: hypothetical protein [Caudoviricetes sp.]